MKKQLLHTFIIFCLVNASVFNSAKAQITFQKTFGPPDFNRVYSAKQTSDGGYIFTGTIHDSLANGISLIKTNSSGDTLWVKSFIYDGGNGGYQFNGEGFSVIQTSDGGYSIIGYGYQGNFGVSFLCFIKTDSIGNLIWFKMLSGNIDDVMGSDIQQTNDGGYIIAGVYYFGTSGLETNPSVYLVKTDSSGNLQWTKTFGGNCSSGEWGNSVLQTNDGGYIITGGTQCYGISGCDVYLIRTDVNGNLLWSKTFGGTANDDGSSIQQTLDGGFVIAGYTESFGVGSGDVYLIKTDSSGNLLWSKTYGGVSYDIATSIHQTSDGGFAILGTTYSFGAGGDMYLIQTDSTGNIIWSKTYGGTGLEYGNSVRQTNDGGFILAGLTSSFGGNEESYLVKTDMMGNSGCNEDTAATIVNTAATQVTIPPTSVLFGGTMDTVSYVLGNSMNISTLCFQISTSINEIQTISNVTVSPNPISNSTTIAFFIPQTQKCSLKVFDVNGRLISTLADKIFNAGENNLEWSVEILNPGIYFLQFQSKENIHTEKLIVTK